MNYMLMLFADERAGDTIPHDQMVQWMEKMAAYQASLEKAGAFVDTVGLARSYEATTIHLENGEMKVQDGPYAETREQLGGFYIIKAESMAEAQKWAAQCPGALWGHVEVRPFSHWGDATA